MEWVRIFPNIETARNVVKAGKPQLLIISGLRICLVMFQETLLAVEDKCTHNGESLSKGSVNYLGEVICPWHGYRFSLRTGREGNERSRDLITFPIKEAEDGVYICV